MCLTILPQCGKFILADRESLESAAGLGGCMMRLIKRYESRKLYDTEESRYVSLEEIAGWVRAGQEVRVVDNATGADVTSQTLTQIILDEGRKGTAFLPSELLPELVRMGDRAGSNGNGPHQRG